MIGSRTARLLRRCLCVLALVSWAGPGMGAEAARSAAATLAVQGIGQEAIRYSLAELRALPMHKVRAEFARGRSAECEGVRLADILAKSGIAMGQALAGDRLSEYLLVSARDGYTVLFALTELDPEFSDAPVLLCLTLDGAAIPEDSGPLRLVVPRDRRHARWVRQVTGLSVKKGW